VEEKFCEKNRKVQEKGCYREPRAEVGVKNVDRKEEEEKVGFGPAQGGGSSAKSNFGRDVDRLTGQPYRGRGDWSSTLYQGGGMEEKR